MWRSAAWMAALVATTLLDQDLGRHRISFDLGGRVDGPSAGALTTSGLLALLGNEGPLLTDATMTGTVNPDGTVGPVGGIPLKVAGVPEAGFTRFGIPLGQRQDVDPCTGEIVDVIELGKSLGVEVREIGDVRQAFAFLAGHVLPLHGQPRRGAPGEPRDGAGSAAHRPCLPRGNRRARSGLLDARSLHRRVVRALSRLGTLIDVVSTSALLVAQHYSLGAETDELGRVIGFRREAALSHMETLAEGEAARAVAIADVASDGAAGPLLLIGLEGAPRSQSAAIVPSDHLMALGPYWSTTLYARLITRLAKSGG
jgi:hypothetical protein